MRSVVAQAIVLGPILYLLYTTDIPITKETTLEVFVEGMSALSFHSDPNDLQDSSGACVETRRVVLGVENPSE